MKSKEKILEKNWMTKGNVYEASPMILNVMDEYAKEVAIDYNKWVSEHQWAKLHWGGNKGSGWHKGQDYNSNSITDEELFELYLKDKGL